MEPSFYPYPEDKPSFDHIDKKLSSYINEVIKPILPNFQPDVKGSAFFSSNLPKHGHISASAFNSSLMGSAYYFNEHPTLIHFTSIESAISIISEGHVRLVGLNKSSDRTELHYCANDFWPDAVKIEQSLLPERYLNISMCIYDEVKKDEDLFDLWRFYGKVGAGIGLVFEFDFSNIEDWFQYHLSKVYYGETNKNLLTSLIAQTDNWCRKNDFQIDDLYTVLLPLYCFHKVGHYKTENEVRLVKRPLDTDGKLEILPQMAGYTVNDFGELVNYEKLFFEGRLRNEMINSFQMQEEADLMFNRNTPKFKIKEVIIGHAIDKTKRQKLKGVITALKVLNNYNFQISDSVFTSLG